MPASSSNSLKRTIYIRITLLALAMSLLLSYQGTQSFLKGLDGSKARQMKQAANYLPEGKGDTNLMFGYHVASSWEHVPDNIKTVFPIAPRHAGKLVVYREDWWYFAPPEKSYAVLLAYNDIGEARYISSFWESPKPALSLGDKLALKDPMVQTALGGTTVILVFMIILYLIFRSLSQPTAAFYQWAGQLTIKTAQNNIPDFRYREINALAHIMHNSMETMGKALEREKQFLGYASHELRTPIAVLRSNATLLDKINTTPSPKEREVRDRILRSSLTMKGITETLLWLSRDIGQPLPSKAVNIAQSLQHVISEQEFLLAGKDINLSIETSMCQSLLPEAAFNILITNIVRNAFQHTGSGIVNITQTHELIRVTNSLQRPKGDQEIGFGLGLELTSKIAQRFGWEFIQNRSETTHEVIVRF